MIFDVSAANAGFVAAAYGLTVVVLLALVIMTLVRARAARDRDDES